MNKPFTRKVLTKKELMVVDKLFNKLVDAYEKDHQTGRCRIKFCNVHYYLTTGKIEHYPNGYYVE
jgi:hypothetical protein